MTLNVAGQKCVWIAGIGLALNFGMVGIAAQAQDAAPPPKSAAAIARTERADRMMTAPTETFYLKNSGAVNDGNEILTGLRLMLDPIVKLYLVPSDNAIVIRALPEDMAVAKKLIEELDRPRKMYRLTYTVSEMDGTKRVGTQHFVLVMQDGQRMVLKSGSKVAVSTGKFDRSANSSETLMTYLDVGYNFDATLTASGSGAQLKTKVERSAVSPERPASGTLQDPTIQQSVLEGTLILPAGKAQLVGSLDDPKGTGRLEIEAMVEVEP